MTVKQYSGLQKRVDLVIGLTKLLLADKKVTEYELSSMAALAVTMITSHFATHDIKLSEILPVLRQYYFN